MGVAIKWPFLHSDPKNETLEHQREQQEREHHQKSTK